MYASARVLIYGHDALLLKTRCWILESAGYPTTTTDATVALNLIFSNEIDLLVLCRTLKVNERQNVLAIAHEVRPTMKNLILSDGERVSSLDSRDTVIDGFVTPAALVAVATYLTRLPHPTDADATHKPALPAAFE